MNDDINQYFNSNLPKDELKYEEDKYLEAEKLETIAKKNIQDESWLLLSLPSVTQSETGETEQDNYTNSYRIRDFDGVLTEVGYGALEEPSMFLRLKRDSSNLVEESGRLGSGGMGAVFKRYTHQCSNQ